MTPLTDFPERFGRLTEVFLYVDGSWASRKIEWARVISGRPVVKLAGIDSREEAAGLTNVELAVVESDLVALPKNTYYVFDLVGCIAIDDENERELGEVTDVLRYPANDVYVIKDRQGREVLFPAVADFVVRIDTAARVLRIRSGGMFDEAADEINGP